MRSVLRYTLFVVLSTILWGACGVSHPEEPGLYTEVSTMPELYPDYVDVTIPSNIAPLNFMINDPEVRQCVARLDYPGGSLCYGDGRKVQIDQQEWNELLQATKGGSIRVTVYTCTDGTDKGGWRRHPSFDIHVAVHEIDPWLSYRLIEPSYVAYEHIDLMQRNLTSFEESIIASNHIGSRREQCLNCHSYQNYHTQNMLYHIRGGGGGTMLTYQGKSRLMTDLCREGMISNPVYPSWHPTLPLVAFSTNHTGQFFHTQSVAKVEVQDTESELVLYDVEHDRMILIPSDREDLENFPTWSPDGRHIYYTSAHYVQRDTATHLDRDMANHYTELQYDLYVRDFDPATMQVGQRRLVLDLASAGQSASLPHVSPDGRHLLYASGQYGCFHIWHADADIRLMDLETMQVDSLELVNSPLADSYPTWSSNGRWIILASRRQDGNYSRVYIAYFDAEGQAHKAFVVPQEDPEHDKYLLRSYNRPETMVECVTH